MPRREHHHRGGPTPSDGDPIAPTQNKEPADCSSFKEGLKKFEEAQARPFELEPPATLTLPPTQEVGGLGRPPTHHGASWKDSLGGRRHKRKVATPNCLVGERVGPPTHPGGLRDSCSPLHPTAPRPPTLERLGIFEKRPWQASPVGGRDGWGALPDGLLPIEDGLGVRSRDPLVRCDHAGPLCLSSGFRKEAHF